jgi:putative hydrolase of the HAD superfamily
MNPAFAHIDTWIFDLDLTLYPPEANIMAQVRDRIALFVQNHFKVGADEAHDIRYRYWKKYGTTLGGLMHEHGVPMAIWISSTMLTCLCCFQLPNCAGG